MHKVCKFILYQIQIKQKNIIVNLLYSVKLQTLNYKIT